MFDKNKNGDEDPGRIKTLADAICVRDYFAQDAGGRLYYYKNGVYRPHGERHVKAMVKTLLTAWGETKAWSTRLASEVVEFIRTDARETPDRPHMDLVNVENGMVRVEDGVLLPHDPKHLSVVQLPVKHDPAAACPSIEAFVAATFPADAHNLAWEIPGVLMVPATWLQMAILLLGEGCNGKSVWLSLIVRFLGRHNVATIPLHRLEADKFAVSRLAGKLANVCADLPSEHLAGTSTFKALTGGDTLSAEYKFKDSFDLEPYARLVFSANHPPRSADSSAAFFRRWKVIPFDHTFAPDEQIQRDVLDARLQAPGELSGLFNRALEGLRRVQRQRRFSEPESTQAAWKDFHATTDPLAVWLDRYTIDDPDTYITKQTLRVAYNAAVERDGRPTMTPKSFGQALYRLRPNIKEVQRTVGGRTQWCYLGIGLADNSNSRNSLDSLDQPLSFHTTQAREGTQGDSSRGGVKKISDDPVNPVNPVDCPTPIWPASGIGK
jgi:P4 family phage/plasmid primase-like protien